MWLRSDGSKLALTGGNWCKARRPGGAEVGGESRLTSHDGDSRQPTRLRTEWAVVGQGTLGLGDSHQSISKQGLRIRLIFR